MLIHMILFNCRIIFPRRNVSRSIYPFSDGCIFRLLAVFCFSSSAVNLPTTLWHLLVCVPRLAGVDICSVPRSWYLTLQSITINLVLLYAPAFHLGTNKSHLRYTRAFCTACETQRDLVRAHACLCSPPWLLSLLLEDSKPFPAPRPCTDWSSPELAFWSSDVPPQTWAGPPDRHVSRGPHMKWGCCVWGTGSLTLLHFNVKLQNWYFLQLLEHVEVSLVQFAMWIYLFNCKPDEIEIQIKSSSWKFTVQIEMCCR